MCGRFVSKAKMPAIEKEFAVTAVVAGESVSEARYNIAPTQVIAAVITNEGARELTEFKWGLVPHWAKESSIGARMINARSETLIEKPSFREAFKKRRCIIPASGFFEWSPTSGKGKQPFYFYLKETEVFGFAGLWETWADRKTGEAVETCTIITTAANAVLKPVHDRMPVILRKGDYDFWLDPSVKDTDRLQKLLVPYPAERMNSHAVGKSVNSPAANSEDLIVPLNSL